MRQIYLLIIGGRAKHGWCLSCRGGWGERCCPRGVTAIHAVAVGRTYHLLLLLSYTQTGMHVGQNFDWVRYSKIAGLSTSLMWHGSLNLVQSCKMWCAVCTLPHSHKSEPHRPINFMLAAIGQRQSSGGWPEPRHFWGGRSLVVVGRMQEWRIGELEKLMWLVPR